MMWFDWLDTWRAPVQSGKDNHGTLHVKATVLSPASLRVAGDRHAGGRADRERPVATGRAGNPRLRRNEYRWLRRAEWNGNRRSGPDASSRARTANVHRPE